MFNDETTFKIDPTEQVLQLEEPLRAYCVPGHVVQAVFIFGEYLPALHGVQSIFNDETTFKKDPAKQALQLEEPIRAYFPVEHVAQSAVGFGEYLPAVQLLQTDEPAIVY